MDLFSGQQIITNILPYDGLVEYHGRVFSIQEADEYFSNLMAEVNWQPDRIMMMGKIITTRRKTAWYGDRSVSYTYAKVTKVAEPWTPSLLRLKNRVEKLTGETYNACLLNLYHDGSEGMSWHSDDEASLKQNAAIASVSFGAERNFAFKHKVAKQTCGLKLEQGSLLVMKGSTQKHWQHRLPPTRKVSEPRINLTFRTIID